MSAELSELASEAVGRFLTSTGADVRPPVDVRALALLSGVRQIRTSAEIVGDGKLERGDGRATIWVNAKSPPVRQRYTMAHELGHFWLRQHDNHLLQQLTSKEEERFCNLFAAELLLPPQWVREMGEVSPGTLQRLEEIASAADVSLMACFISLRRLPAWRRCLLVWRRIGSSWRLNSVVSPSRSSRELLEISYATDEALNVIARMPDGRAFCNLPLCFDGERIHPRSEVAVRFDGAVAMTDLPTARNGRPALRPPAQRRELLDFAMPRAPRQPNS